MASVDQGLRALDDEAAALVVPALATMRRSGASAEPDADQVWYYLRHDLPAAVPGGDRHETAWALGDLFEGAGLVEQSALCRDPRTHEILTVWRWADSFSGVPSVFWRPAFAGLEATPGPPPGVELSLVSARALLDAVGEPGVGLDESGDLPTTVVLGLDDRFRWTEEFPWMHRTGEQGIPPVRWLREHLTAQQLLLRDGGRLSLTGAGRVALGDSTLLWRAVVDPAPRWSQDFERDALGLMAASLLSSGVFSPDRMPEAITKRLAVKWRPVDARAVFEGAALVAHAWYRLGVPLGWWDTGRGPADRHPNVFGRAAAVAVFRSMGRAPRRATGPGVERPA